MLAILESGLAADGDVSNIRIRRVVQWIASGLSIESLDKAMERGTVCHERQIGPMFCRNQQNS